MTHKALPAFHVLLIGDFSGRANCRLLDPDQALVHGRPRPVDCDNFDDLLSRLNVRLDRIIVGDNDQPVSLRFTQLDDFHPDQLVEQMELFASLRTLRRRLLNPNTFESAAQEVLAWNPAPPEQSEAATPKQEPAPDTDVHALLDEMLARSSSIDANPPEIDFQQFIKQIVAPYMPRSIDPRQDQLVACVDAATETLMTALLHHPHFQQLESTWRGLDFLVRRIESDTELKVFVLDVSQAELAADLLDEHGQPRTPSNTRIYSTLVERTVRTPGGIPWSFVGWLHPIAPTTSDQQLLAQLAQLCRLAETRLVASVHGKFVGCERPTRTPAPEEWTRPTQEWKSAWDAFRNSAAGNDTVLLWPRFLLRLPYGAKTNPIDAFTFEELRPRSVHDQLLWGNPIFAVGAAICQRFSDEGWQMDWSRGSDIAELPWLITRHDGEPVAHPCGELLLSERGAMRLRELGITPILSFPNRNAVRIPVIESISNTHWS